MVNLVGEDNKQGPVIYKNMDQIIGIKGVNPHIYGKKKLGLIEKWDTLQ